MSAWPRRGAGPALTVPRWAAPANVGAAMSRRAGGVSAGPWASLNLGGACGDEAAAVAENRARYAAAIGAVPVWLRQVHGREVVRLTAGGGAAAGLPPADAAWTTERGLACTVLVADCLPVLFSTRDGRAVAAAHAGWRGLAAGVLEATVAALGEGAGASPAELVAWIGPGIGPRRFEVGVDVLQAFGADLAAATPRFRRRRRPGPDGRPRWWADLPALAAQRLVVAGLGAVAVDGRCTAGAPSAFFSHRRDGLCGRMAASVWRRG